MKNLFFLSLAIACCMGGSCAYARHSDDKAYIKQKDIKIRDNKIFVKTKFGYYEVRAIFSDEKGLFVVNPHRRHH